MGKIMSSNYMKRGHIYRRDVSYNWPTRFVLNNINKKEKIKMFSGTTIV